MGPEHPCVEQNGILARRVDLVLCGDCGENLHRLVALIMQIPRWYGNEYCTKRCSFVFVLTCEFNITHVLCCTTISLYRCSFFKG